MNNYFLSLFDEFIALLEQKKLLNSRFNLNYDKTPYVDFQLLFWKLDIPELESLPSFNPLFKLIANNEGTSLKEAIRRNIYTLFGHEFSELFNYRYLSTVIPANLKNPDADLSKINNESFIIAICESKEVVKENEYLIFFENLEIENEFVVDDTLSFIRIDKEFRKLKIQSYYDSDIEWSKVKVAIHYSGEFKNDDLLIKISTLLKLFKEGDVSYKSIYQKQTHWYKGEIYRNCKNENLEINYIEHPIPKRALRQYLIKDNEVDRFSLFLKENLPKMSPLIYSSRLYNSLSSINHQIEISIQFFVIESFFPHIRFTDIQKETVKAVRIILDENDKFKKTLWKYYDIRSDIAHGDLEEADNKKIKMGDKESLSMILKRLWIKLLAISWNPKESEVRLIELIKDKEE